MSTERYDVFLAHNGADKPAVLHVAALLKQHGLTYFLDSKDIEPGEVFIARMSRGMMASNACAVLLGPAGVSDFHREEAVLALNRSAKDPSFRVILVILPGGDERELEKHDLGLLTTRSHVRFKTLDDADALALLLTGLGPPKRTEQAQASAEPPPTTDDRADDRCPFMGLPAYGLDDADLFFGREQATLELMQKLRQSCFLAVVGPSGSGKSSLVNAGLAHALVTGAPLADGSLPIAGVARECVYVVKPGSHPIEKLAAEVAGESAAAMDELVERMKRDPGALRKEFTRRLQRDAGRDARVLIVVNQGEELFTRDRQPDSAERRAFVDNLLALVEPDASPDNAILVVITLRADFYAHFAHYPGLWKLLENHQHNVAPMSRDELRAAITKPAERLGYALVPMLVEQLLDDVGEAPGPLPLLSHALQETWRRREGRRLTLKGYLDVGRVRGALAQTAESVYLGLSPEERAIAQRIFVRLVAVGDGEQDTRRRASKAEFAHNPGQAEAVERVLGKLVAARLVTMGARKRAGAPDAVIVELAHEALIGAWARYAGWLREDREGRRAQQRLADDGRLWDERGRREADLYQGARLALAREWADRHVDETNPVERDFLAASRAVAERGIRRLRALAIALGLAFIVAIGLFGAAAWFANQAKHGLEIAERNAQEARDNALRAEREANLSLARELASLAIIDNPPQRAWGMPRAAEALARFPQDDKIRQLTADRIESPLQRGQIVKLGDNVTATLPITGSSYVVVSTASGQGFLWDVKTGASGIPLAGAVEAVRPLTGTQFVLDYVGINAEWLDVSGTTPATQTLSGAVEAVRPLDDALFVFDYQDNRSELWQMNVNPSPQRLSDLDFGVEDIWLERQSGLLIARYSDGEAYLFDLVFLRAMFENGGLRRLAEESPERLVALLCDGPLKRPFFTPEAVREAPGNRPGVACPQWC
jgi:hypothetical protein